VQFPGVATPTVPISVQDDDELTVTAPVGTDFTGQLTVETSGGTSNAFDLSASGNTEEEPNDTTATATPFNVGPPPRELTETKPGSIDPVGDVDFYRVDVDFINLGPFFEARVFPPDPIAPALTLRLTWLDQDGVTVLATTEGTATGPEELEEDELIIDFSPSVNGTYFLKIEEITGQGSVNHTYEIIMNVFVPL